MDIMRKTIEVEINEKEYSMILDFASAIEFQSLYGESIFKGFEKISNDQDFYALACLLASTIKHPNNKSVGMDFIGKLDLIGSLEYFMGKLGELMNNSLPGKTEEEKK